MNNFSYANIMVQDDFKINEATGDVTVLRDLRSYQAFYLGVQVSDRGQDYDYFTE